MNHQPSTSSSQRDGEYEDITLIPLHPRKLQGPIVHLLCRADAEHKSYTHLHGPMKHGQQAYDQQIRDPKLTFFGQLQCAYARGKFQWYTQEKYITHIFSSPMSRAVETAFRVLADVPTEVDIIALPDLQTLGNGPNGTGLDFQDMRAIYGHDQQGTDHSTERRVVLTFMQEDWNSKNAKYHGLWSAYMTHWRQNQVKGILKGIWVNQPDAEVVLVGHGSFFNLLVGQSRDSQWKPIDWRSYGFDENGDLSQMSFDEIMERRAGYDAARTATNVVAVEQGSESSLKSQPSTSSPRKLNPMASVFRPADQNPAWKEVRSNSSSFGSVPATQ